MREKSRKKWILLCDGGILFAGLILALGLGLWGQGMESRIGLGAALLCAAGAGADLLWRAGGERPLGRGRNPLGEKKPRKGLPLYRAGAGAPG